MAQRLDSTNFLSHFQLSFPMIDIRSGVPGATLTSEDARENLKAMSVNLRKRRKDLQLQKSRFDESPEKLAKKARDNRKMTDMEALEAILAFWRSNPREQDFNSLMENAIHGIKTFRRALTEYQPEKIIDNIVRGGLLDKIFFLLDLPFYYSKLVDLTKDERVGTIQFEAAWCLTNIAATHQTIAIMEHKNSLDVLGRAIYQSKFANVREQALWCVANMAGFDGKKTTHFRKQILGNNSIMEGMFINIKNPANPSLLCTSIWALGNTIQDRSPPKLEQIQVLLDAVTDVYGEVYKKSDLAADERDKIFEEVFSALRKGMWFNTEVIEHVGKSATFIPHMMGTLKQARRSGNLAVMVRAMRCIEIFLSKGSLSIQDALIANDFLGEATHLLREQKNDHLLIEVCSALGNYLNGADSQRFKSFRARGCLASVVEVAHASSWYVKKEAYRVLFKFLIFADHNGRIHFFSTGCAIQVLCESLESTKNLDKSLCLDALRAVESLLQDDREHKGELGVCRRLQEFHGFSTIERMQTLSVTDIQEMAAFIVDEYFAHDENEAEDYAPTTDIAGNSVGSDLKLQSPAPLAPRDSVSPLETRSLFQG